MCLQSLCTGNFLYHAKGKSNRQKQSWNLHFLAFQNSLQLKCQLRMFVIERFGVLSIFAPVCAPLSAVPDNLSTFLFSISIKNCFNTSHQKKTSEANSTTRHHRNDWTNWRATIDWLKMNEFLHFQFFSCLSIEWEMCFGFLRQTNRTPSVLRVVYSSTWIKFARLSMLSPLTGILHNNTYLTPEIGGLSATLPANFRSRISPWASSFFLFSRTSLFRYERVDRRTFIISSL